jgi:TonB family protein
LGETTEPVEPPTTQLAVPEATPTTNQSTQPAAPSRAMSEVVVHGRSESLVGVADTSNQGYAGQAQIIERPLLRPAEILETVPGLVITQHSGPGKSTFHWHIARGDAAAQNGISIRSQPDESGSMDQQASISVPPMPSQAVVPPPALTDASEDASVLPDRLLPPPAVPDAVIGIGSSQTMEAVPHSAARKPPVQLAGAVVGSSLSKSPASGVSTPPREAGPRGQRDGFDSRGLPIPDYPPESRRRGEEGVVVVDVEVLPDGSVGVIRVVSDSGHPRLAAAAVEKLKTASFEPALQDGKRVVGHILIPYRFTLE